MSRGTVRIVLLLLSAVYVSAIRQPLTVKQLEQVDPTTLVSTVPQAAVETVPAAASTVVAQEAITAVDPATAAVEVAALPVDSTPDLTAPAEVLLVSTTVTVTAEDTAASAQAVSSATAVTAYAGNTLGIGFSGSGFLIMYHVGVTALLRKLGIINSRVKFAGASGGSVAAAYSCARDTSGVQKAFRGAAGTLAANCRPTVLNPLANNCKFTLDSAVKSYLFAALPGGVVTDCTNRLFVAVTNATTNREAVPDTRRFVTVSAQNTRLNVSEALAASSYIPRFSGVSAVTRPSSPILGGSTIPVVYDGVATDPLPVPPVVSGVTYTITVSAVNTSNSAAPPNTVFDYLVDEANKNTLLDVTACPLQGLPGSDATCYTPLTARKEAQPASVDIWPGRSGSLVALGEAWNNFILKVPSADNNKKLYNQGRNDAKAWVRATFPSSGTNAITDTAIAAAMTATAPPSGIFDLW